MKTKKTTRPKIGAKTPRGGAVIVARSLIDPDGWAVVLAVTPKGEYVTWNESAEGEYQSGEYCQVWADATTAYAIRRQSHDIAACVRKGGSANAVRKINPETGLTDAQESQLVRSAYENFPEAAQCFGCESYSYGDKPGRPFRFVFVDQEEEGKRYTITEADAVRGLRVFAALVKAGKLPGLGLPADFLSPADNFDILGQWDAFAFDALAQCAMFGAVIYG